MILELLILNIPHQKINQAFNDFLFSTLNLKNSHLVHHQQEDNKKVLLLRLQDESKYNVLQGMKLKYEDIEIEFKAYDRPIIERINKKLKKRKELFSKGEVDPENEVISRIYLSNVPKYLKEQELKKIMSKFGNVVSVGLPKKTQEKPQDVNPRQKCRLAVVQFETFEEAVKVFFLDKIKIRDKKIKIKLYIQGKMMAKSIASTNSVRLSKNGKDTTSQRKEIEENSSRKSLEEEEARLNKIIQKRKKLQIDSLIFKSNPLVNTKIDYWRAFNPNYSGNGSFFYAYDPHFSAIKERCGRRQNGFTDEQHYGRYQKKAKQIFEDFEAGDRCIRVKKGMKLAKVNILHFEENLRLNLPLLESSPAEALSRWNQARAAYGR